MIAALEAWRARCESGMQTFISTRAGGWALAITGALLLAAGIGGAK